ncbi:MAG: AarF/ABC1/UbiB kinase family protein [Thermodesulfobacteriota bacterium]
MLIRRIGQIGRTYRQIERYTEILSVLIKFGFGDLVAGLKVEQYLNIGRQIFFLPRKEKIETLTRAVRVRMVLEELGPTFIKLGQMLSTRPDLLPAEFLEELVKLQDDVAPFPFHEAQEIMAAELKRSPEKVFPRIETEPLAAASIAQVHRARLADGEEVVIKVQRPGIRRVVEVDLEILLHLATLVERHLEGWDVYRPTKVVEEFGQSLENEMDFSIEAANMERFAALYREDPNVYIPKVFREFTTPRVLTMEYVEGLRAGALDRLRQEGHDLRRIADLGARMVLEQTLVFGFFHADPHPGNLMVLPGPAVCLLDMGMVGRLDRRTREDIVDLLLGLVERDPAAVVSALCRLTEWEEEPDRRALEREVSVFMDRHLNRPLKEMQLGGLLRQVFDAAIKFRLYLLPDLLLLIKALTTIEGLARRLDPGLDLVAKAEPFVKKVQAERYHPHRLAGDLWDYGKELLDILKEMPADLRGLLRLARNGKIKIEIEPLGWEHMRVTQDRTSNRLSFAIVLAGLIVGSSLVIQSGIPPTWHGIPVIGLAGYIVAGLMGFWLLITILRRGMM